eukprot:TRINITY_DN7551_c1_g1_i1.p1 TRINITY_DN7551_c1_g1~~TRINITY_DN7551_c1_g1_i1.p1  ORF type:complete len:687 (-),score=140.09 TRINITY_DN7551_c1_g1_i1:13-2073(-)
MASPAPQPGPSSLDLLLDAVRLLKAVAVMKAAPRTSLPLKTIAEVELFVQTLVSKEHLERWQQSGQVGAARLRTLLRNCIQLARCLERAPHDTAIAPPAPYVAEMFERAVALCRQLAEYGSVALPPSPECASELGYNAQTVRLNDHLLFRLHLMRTGCRFVLPCVEEFWQSHFHDAGDCGWTDFLRVLRIDYPELEPPLVEISRRPALQAELQRQLAHGALVTVATLNAFVSTSAALDWPAAMATLVNRLTQHLPQADVGLRVLAEDLSLVQPEAFLVFVSDHSLTLPMLRNMNPYKLEALLAQAGIIYGDRTKIEEALHDLRNNVGGYKERISGAVSRCRMHQQQEEVRRRMQRRTEAQRELEVLRNSLGLPARHVNLEVIRPVLVSRCPRTLTDLLPFLQRANEYCRSETPLIALYCKKYAVLKARSEVQANDQAGAQFLDELESEVKRESASFVLPPDGEGQGLVADAALGLLEGCTAKLRAGIATKDEANVLHIVQTLLTVCSLFGPLPAELSKQRETVCTLREVLQSSLSSASPFAFPDEHDDEAISEEEFEAENEAEKRSEQGSDPGIPEDEGVQGGDAAPESEGPHGEVADEDAENEEHEEEEEDEENDEEEPEEEIEDAAEELHGPGQTESPSHHTAPPVEHEAPASKPEAVPDVVEDLKKQHAAMFAQFDISDSDTD